MTAAHCLTGRNAEDVQVVVGDHDVTTATETDATVVHDAQELIINENYDSNTNKNDIGLIKLTKPIEYNANVGPVCLPWNLQDKDLEGKTTTLAGWGTTEFGGPKSPTLQKVDVKVTSDEACKAAFPNSDETNLCTFEEDKDSCNVCRDGNDWALTLD